MVESKKVCFHLILDLLAVLGTLLRKNGFSQTSAVSVQLLLKREGVIHTDTYCRAASSSSYLSRIFNDCAPDGICRTGFYAPSFSPSRDDLRKYLPE